MNKQAHLDSAASQAAISVVFPVMRKGEDPRETLDSILQQSLRPVEIIVVSAGANEELTRQLSSYADVVKLMTCPQHASISLARNVGAEAATADLIAFADSSDVWHPDKLALQAAWLGTHAATALVHTGCTTLINGETVAYLDKPLRLTSRDLMNAGHLTVSSVLMRKQVMLDSGGFDVSFRHTEGFEFAFRLVDQGHNLDFLAQPLLHLKNDSAANGHFDWRSHFVNHGKVVWRNRRHYREHAGWFGPWQHTMKHLANAGYKQRGASGRILRMVAKMLWPFPARAEGQAR